MEDHQHAFDDENLYEYRKISTGKQVRKLCRRMDLYALPITLRYKSEKKFYTNFGALTSLLLIIATICFLVVYTRDLFAGDRVT